VSGLYVIDSIVRQSRHQFGADKDVFAQRFAKNIHATFQLLLQGAPNEKVGISVYQLNSRRLCEHNTNLKKLSVIFCDVMLCVHLVIMHCCFCVLCVFVTVVCDCFVRRRSFGLLTCGRKTTFFQWKPFSLCYSLMVPVTSAVVRLQLSQITQKLQIQLLLQVFHQLCFFSPVGIWYL